MGERGQRIADFLSAHRRGVYSAIFSDTGRILVCRRSRSGVSAARAVCRELVTPYEFEAGQSLPIPWPSHDGLGRPRAHDRLSAVADSAQSSLITDSVHGVSYF
jgi:hypothetical protein